LSSEVNSSQAEWTEVHISGYISVIAALTWSLNWTKNFKAMKLLEDLGVIRLGTCLQGRLSKGKNQN